MIVDQISDLPREQVLAHETLVLERGAHTASPRADRAAAATEVAEIELGVLHRIRHLIAGFDTADGPVHGAVP